MALFHGLCSIASRLEPPWGGSLLFTIKFPENTGPHFLSTSAGRTNNTNKYRNLIQRKGYRSYVAKMLFLQVDKCFSLVSKRKISKLIFCFSILLLQFRCWVQKNLARLRGHDILSSCINAEPIMINSRKWASYEPLLWMHVPLS